MKTLVRLSVLALVALVGSSFGATVYSQSVNNASSVYITAGTHGLGSTCAIGISVYDAGSKLMEASGSPGYSAPSCSSGNITINFNASFTGTVKLVGPLSSDNNATDAFKPVVSGNLTMVVCSGASVANHQAVTVSSYRRVCLHETQITVASGDDYTIRIWLDGQKIVVASDGGTMPTLSATNEHTVRLNYQSSFPSGAIQVAQIRKRAGDPLSSFDLNDLRSWK